MKRTLTVILGVFAVFFLAVVVILVVDISNDVEYSTVEVKEEVDSRYVRIETDATSKEDLTNLVKQIEDKSRNEENVDAVWLWIHKTGENTLLAAAGIPYNAKGEAMIGATDRNNIIEWK